MPPAFAFLEPEAWPFAAVLFGLVVGSFANVLIHRLPRGESITFPPSRCPACGARILARDNVPVLGWLLLRGRCRACKASISPRYPLVEAGHALLWGLTAALLGPTPRGFFALYLVTVLLSLALIDAEHQLLPDKLTLPSLALALGLSFVPGWPVLPVEAFASAAGGWLMMAAVAVAAERHYGEEALGQGDWKLTALLGAALGWRGCLLSVLLGSLAGALYGGAMIAAKRGSGRSKVAFGTFLAVGALVALLFGAPILDWYAGFFEGGLG
jgi:leader peptidase (prepilin peptidase)/N-methyltransferase